MAFSGSPIDVAFVKIVADTRTFTSDLKKDVHKSVTGVSNDLNNVSKKTTNSVNEATKKHKGMFSSLAGSAKGAFGAIAGVIAVGKAVSFARSAMAEARESQKVNAQTAAVLKSTGGAANVTAKQISNLATSISNKTGIDDEQIQSSENMLLTFTNVRNEVGKGNNIFDRATKTVTDMSAALGQSGKSSAIQLGKALNDPIKGITALSRVGVTFTDKQKATIKSMVKTGDTLGAQKVILNELNKEFGGSAASQATAGEKMRTTWNNVKEAIGTALIPAIDKLENWISQKLLPAFTQLIAYLQTNWPAIMKQVHAALDPVVKALKSMAKFVMDNKGFFIEFGKVLAAFIPLVLAIVTAIKLVTIAQAAWNAVTDANAIVLIVIALAALVTALIYAYKHSETFRNIVNGVFSSVKAVALGFVHFFTRSIPAAFSTVLDFVKRWGPLMLVAVLPVVGIPLLIWQHFSLIKGYVVRAFTAVVDAVTHFFTRTIPNAFKAAWPIIKRWGLLMVGAIFPLALVPGLIVAFWGPISRFFSGLGKKIVGLVHGASTWLLNTGHALITGIWTGITISWRTVSNFFGGIKKRFTGWLSGASTWLGNGGKAVINGLWNGISVAWRTIRNWFDGLKKRFLGFVVGASIWLVSHGRDLISGLWNGISRRWSDVKNWFDGLKKRFLGFVIGAGIWLVSHGRDLISGLWTGISRRWNDIKNWFGGLKTRFVNFLVGASNWFISHGRDLISGLWGGINTRWNDIKNWFSGIGTRFKNFLVGASGWLRSHGSALIGGLWGGISARWDDVKHWFSGMKTRASNFFVGSSRWLYDRGRKIIHGLWDGMGDVWQAVKGWFKSLSKKILGYLGIHSPPKWAVDAGHWMMKGVLKGLGRGAHAVKSFFTNTAKSLGASAGQINNWIKNNNPFGENKIGGKGTFVGTPPSGNSGTGSIGAEQNYAKSLLPQFGWVFGQLRSLISLWNGESGWNPNAQNPGSSAYGIAQFLDSTWAGVGGSKTSDWKKQILYGMRYIQQSYGSPAAAFAAWSGRSPHWYDKGSWKVPTTELAMVHKNEMIIPAKPAAAIRASASAGGSAGGQAMDYNAMERAFRRALAGAKFTMHIDGNGLVTLVTKGQAALAVKGSRL
jgi:hypothetical protein